MIENRSSGRARVVRTRRRPDHSLAPLAEIDRRLLDMLCTHRVVHQDQLGRLFPDIPERTLRSRTRRLHDLGLAGRSRPYREQGSAPNHHWPTRRADCLMRGEPTPRGGERKQPNPLLLAHAATLTELYVAFITHGRNIGLAKFQYYRESEARESFTDGTRERALAPDATLVLIDEHDRELLAFVEIDLGTMSHTRLRAKAELYAAYLEWRERSARQLARQAGPLGRLTHRPEDSYPQLDRDQLKACGRCEEIVYPVSREELNLGGQRRQSSCHYCDATRQLRDHTDPPIPSQ